MKQFLLILAVITNIFSFRSTTVQATSSDDRVPYSVRARLPENQDNAQVSYFDLKVVPGANQTLEVEVFNSSDEEITVVVDTNFGATNTNGLVTYDGSIEDYDETMAYSFNDISQVYEQEITIPANDSELALVDLFIPEEGFDGQILGGIHFVLDREDDQTDAAVGFVNQYAYVIGVNLEQVQPEHIDSEENPELVAKLQVLDNAPVEAIDPELDLNYVRAELINYRTGINAVFSNKTPVLINNLNFQAWITEVGDEEVLYERTVENFSVGPNNIFHFPISLNNAPLDPGDYTFYALAENETDTFEFSQDFTITEEVADDINEESVELEDNSYWAWLIGGVIGLIILLIVVVIILLKKLKAQNKV